MSDQLDAASAALGAPPDLVQRSAAARAEASGSTVDDVLAAWGGGASVVATISPAPAAPEPAADPVVASPTPAAPAAVIVEASAAPAIEQILEEEEPLDPAPLGDRLKVAVRVGAWTGAALGVVGFLAASAFWAPNAQVTTDGGPVVQVTPGAVVLGMSLVSIIFGAVVAGFSSAAAGWTDPAMRLTAARSRTAWFGGATGLVLGLVGATLLLGLGTVVEGSDPEVTQLPVLATLFVMVVGGAVLGAATSVIPQALGVPVAVDPAEGEEVEQVRRRLGNAVSVPMVGILLLLVLVLPFAWVLIESNHLLPGAGGALVATIAAGGILGFAALAGSKPQMRISMGDVVVAVVGIATVLVIILAVLLANQEPHEDEGDHAEAAAVLVI